ncbi:MAG: Mur ligase family protein [Myxococcota bacterium]
MDDSQDIYLIGIAGTGMGALAGLLKALGHRVRGSDEHVYPPMSDKLAEWGIPVVEGFDPGHLEPAPDRVVVGNVIRRENPEAAQARDASMPTWSMPQAVAEYGIRDRHSVVVTGTHGKTSITAMVAHLLMSAGRDPGFLVGGALLNYRESFHAGSGDHFVVEGDEYDTAYFDKGPKFHHYRPRTVVITSLEFDHADIYDSVEAIETNFEGLVERVPPDGHLVVWAGAQRALRIAKRSGRPLTVYDESDPEADLVTRAQSTGEEGLSFEPVLRGESLGQVRVAQWGRFSANNALAAIGAALQAGLSPVEIARGLASFRGVKRRMEVIGQPRDVVVVDDFAHHPTALFETLSAARLRWPGHKLWAIFEPRSASTRRRTFQDALVESFLPADEIIVGSHPRLAEIEEAERFSPEKLAQDLNRRAKRARAIADVSEIASTVAREAQAGDVVMICSNGAFGGLHAKLLERLAA